MLINIINILQSCQVNIFFGYFSRILFIIYIVLAINLYPISEFLRSKKEQLVVCFLLKKVIKINICSQMRYMAMYLFTAAPYSQENSFSTHFLIADMFLQFLLSIKTMYFLFLYMQYLSET